MKNVSLTLAASLLALSTSVYFAQAAAPNDAQIADIVVFANTVDIDAARIAKNKSHNKEVKAFTSKDLKDGGATNIAHLKSLKGAEFDKAHVDNEVSYHQTALDAIDTILIPNSNNAGLKVLLEKVKPVIAAHLDLCCE